MHINIRFGEVVGQAWGSARARHRVPLVADTASVQNEWIVVIDAVCRRARWRRHEVCLAVRMVEATADCEARGTSKRALNRRAARSSRNGPLNRFERVVLRARQLGETRDIEGSRSVVAKAGE